MEKHLRDLYEFLLDYGATGLRLIPGGKHNKLVFTFKGQEVSYLVANSPATDPRALQNNRSRLKRLLGPAVAPTPKTHRTLEELMPNHLEITAPSAPVITESYPVSLAAYQVSHLPPGQLQVYICLPTALTDTFPKLFTVSRLDEEHWKLTPKGRHTFRAEPRKPDTMKVIYTDKTNLPPFGMSQGEAIKTDNDILIFLAQNDRKGIRVTRSTLVPPTPALSSRPTLAI